MCSYSVAFSGWCFIFPNSSLDAIDIPSPKCSTSIVYFPGLTQPSLLLEQKYLWTPSAREICDAVWSWQFVVFVWGCCQVSESFPSAISISVILPAVCFVEPMLYHYALFHHTESLRFYVENAVETTRMIARCRRRSVIIIKSHLRPSNPLLRSRVGIVG